MSAEASTTLLSVFLVFCRIGACLMLLPGYSTAQVPPQVRLFIAFGLALAISPGLVPEIVPLMREAGDDARLLLIVTEIANGLMIGLLGRVFLLALQFAGNFVANAIGMGQALGAPMEEGTPLPALVPLITMTATVMIFSLNLHAEVILALVASYATIPVELGFSVRSGLMALADNLDETFWLCLRIASPFVLYAIIVNFAIGLANKMTPQIPIYFISLPFVLAGGLVLLGFSIGDFLTVFVAGFRNWVFNG